MCEPCNIQPEIKGKKGIKLPSNFRVNVNGSPYTIEEINIWNSISFSVIKYKERSLKFNWTYFCSIIDYKIDYIINTQNKRSIMKYISDYFYKNKNDTIILFLCYLNLFEIQDKNKYISYYNFMISNIIFENNNNKYKDFETIEIYNYIFSCVELYLELFYNFEKHIIDLCTINLI